MNQTPADWRQLRSGRCREGRDGHERAQERKSRFSLDGACKRSVSGRHRL